MRSGVAAPLVAIVALLAPVAARAITIDGNITGGEGWCAGVHVDSEPALPNDVYEIRLCREGGALGTGTLYIGIEYRNFDCRGWTGGFGLNYTGGTPGAPEQSLTTKSNGACAFTADLGAAPLTAAQGGVGTGYVEIAVPEGLMPAAYAADGFIEWSYTSGIGVNTDYYPNSNFMHYWGATNTTTDAQVIAVAARVHEGGVVVRWETGAELANLGFHLYRDEGGELVPVARELIPGGGTAGAGATYELLDERGREGSVYVLEDVAESGRRMRHRPIIALRPAPARPAPPAARRLPLQASLPPPRPLAPLATLATPAPDPAPSAAVLSAQAPGFHAVRRSELAAAGLPPGVANAPALALTRRGRSVRLLARPSADPDELIFYAAEPEHAYDGVERFWLAAGSDTPVAPLRLQLPAKLAPLASFRDTVTTQPRELYDWYTGGDDAYGWQAIRPGSGAVVLVDAPDPAGPGRAELEVRLHGGRDFSGGPDHRYSVELNGHALGEVVWEGKRPGAQSFAIGAAWLDPGGRNTLRVQAAPGVNPSDLVYLHGASVTYDRRFAARDGRLEFSAARGAPIRIGGFASADVLLADVTDPDAPAWLEGRVVAEAGGTFALELFDERPGRTTSRYLAATAAAMRAPGVRVAGPPRLLGGAFGADLLVVTTEELAPELDGLVALRRSQGLEVEVVTVREAADAFTWGHPGPDSIRALVNDALARWSPAPAYLLLAGQGSMDPRGLLRIDGDREQVPAKFVQPAASRIRSPSDVWYALDGDRVRLAVGRIPASTPEELRAVVAKLLAADAALPSGRVLGVADGFDGGPTDEFEAELDGLLAGVAPDARTTVRAREAPDPAAQKIAAALEGGVDLVAYAGHAWQGGWGWDVTLLGTEAAGALRNRRLPLVVTSTCWEGNFSDARTRAVAWSLVQNPEGGALASFSPTTVLPLGGHRPLAAAVIEAATRGAAATIGEAVRAGQQAALDRGPGQRESVETFVLIGDPSARNPLSP